MLVSFFGIITLFFRHYVKAHWLNEDLPYELHNSKYVMKLDGREEIENTGVRRKVWFSMSFWLEALIFLVFPLPFTDWLMSFSTIDINNKNMKVQVYYLSSDFILVLMFLRVFFVIRAVFNYNMYTD